ncbi:MAG: hypothetical protein WCT77_14065 [Bacteroidota bacterium]
MLHKRSLCNTKLKLLVFIFAFFLITQTDVLSQFSKGFSAAGGISTTTILGNNPTTRPFFERDSSKAPSYGGGFNGPQMGMGVKFFFPLDTSERFVIPLGFEYQFFDSRERVPLTNKLLQEITHTYGVGTISLGLNYTLKRYVFANTRIYFGLEGRTTMLSTNKFSVYTHYSKSDSTEFNEDSFKSAATRLGAALRLGIEGQFMPNWFVNISGGVGILNLFGKENERGELFTPKKQTFFYIEDKETTIYSFHFAFLIQYKM